MAWSGKCLPDTRPRRKRSRRVARGNATFDRGTPGYPAALLDLENPPSRLHVRGALPRGCGVAIVGSRAATEYGRGFAFRLAEDLARLGHPVVSGLARGIDAA